MKKIFKVLFLLVCLNPLAEIQVFSQQPTLLSLKRQGPEKRMKEEPMTDERFLDILQKKCFLFFWEQADPKTGLIKDRANNFAKSDFKIASSASTGFGLTALCIAESRGWLTRKEVYDRILVTLKFFKNRFYNKKGFFYHFTDMTTGKREWNSEISTIDTALFLAGALFAGEYFKGTEIEKIADQLYCQADWRFFTNNGKFVSMGSGPEPNSFIGASWSVYCETVLLDIMAIGSPTHPIGVDTWRDMGRPLGNYKGYNCISCPPLFTHQYHNLWIDFRNKHDGNADYFENARIATLANREYCIDNQKKYKTYGPDCWGLTACDGPDGYKAYGSLPGHAIDDGTIAPTAAGGSIQFTPKESIACLKYMYYTYKPRIWGKYGFCDSFNVNRNWSAPDVIGIDLGAIVLSIENYRTGMVWKYFMRNKHIKKGMEKIGFKNYKKNKKNVIDLTGKWLFRRGDHMQWSRPEFNDKRWRKINVPGYWEDNGHPGYDGSAWYRVHFEIPEDMKEKWKGKKIILYIGAVDDSDVSYFNGRRIGGMGEFPPGRGKGSAWDKYRAYPIPERLIRYGRKNTLAIRVGDNAMGGGILGEVKIGPKEDLDWNPFRLKVSSGWR